MQLDNYDPGTAEAERIEAIERSQLLERIHKDDLLWIMSAPQGRRWMWRHLEECGLFRSSYIGGTRDDMIFCEGARNVALRQVARLKEHCPDYWIKMQQENQ